MIFIVEIQDKDGQTARKEYEAMNLRDALCDVERDLRQFPNLYLNEVWQKGGANRGLYSGRKL